LIFIHYAIPLCLNLIACSSGDSNPNSVGVKPDAVIPDGCGVDALASKFGLIPGVSNCGVCICALSSDAGALLLNKPPSCWTVPTPDSCSITASLGGCVGKSS